MTQPITPLMQQLQNLATRGNHYWCTDGIDLNAWERFLRKWGVYELQASDDRRAYRRRTGKAANRIFCMPGTTTHGKTQWLIVGTAGKCGLSADGPQPGKVYDCRRAGQHLRFQDYELVYAMKQTKGKATMSTWTWRIQPERLKEIQARAWEYATHGNAAGLHGYLVAQSHRPMFAGVRRQVLALVCDAARELRKRGLELAPISLPVMRKRLKTPPPAPPSP